MEKMKFVLQSKKRERVRGKGLHESLLSWLEINNNFRNSKHIMEAHLPQQLQLYEPKDRKLPINRTELEGPLRKVVRERALRSSIRKCTHNLTRCQHLKVKTEL